MLNRLLIAAASMMLLVAAVGPSFAGERIKFDAGRLAADQKGGKSILVHVTAPWCPTCKAQKPIIDGLAAKPEFKDLVIYDLDFDTGIEGLKLLKARAQSTLVVFKGEKEIGRSAGDTNPERIEALLKQSL